MKNRLKEIKVAIVSDHCFSFAGASHTTRELAGMFHNPDYYFLMGNKKSAEKYFNSKNIYFSFLNKLPLIHKYYRYTYFLWPVAIESFDFSKYDLVISSSFSVAHGVITGLDTKHIAYIHTPMRYAWDLYKKYFGNSFFVKRWIISFLLNMLRMWDVSASSRADILIANSTFVSDRIHKYWRRDCNYIVYPPVHLYEGEIISKRDEYFVVGAPFEENKEGAFVFECAVNIGFKLKVIGSGNMIRRLKRRYSKYSNIEFLGRVSEEEKWDILSKANGFICAGIEDFGIFPVEAMSAGTPVLAYRGGGYIESVVDSVNGMFFNAHTLKEFNDVYKKFLSFKWDREKIVKSSRKFSKDRFIKEMEEIVLKNL